MTIQKGSKIGDVVARNFRAAAVFDNFGIDYCFTGNKSIAEACTEKGIDSEKFMEALSKAGENSGVPDYNSWELDRLIDHIVSHHHSYVKSALPVITETALKVAGAHGSVHTETVEISRLVAIINEELEMHLAKEEKMLFPYIKKLVSLHKEGLQADYPPFGTIHNPIRVMESEHVSAGNFLSEITRFSNNYSIPDDASSSYNELYNELKKFEKDLLLHIHLENNILFPKAIKLEESLGHTPDES